MPTLTIPREIMREEKDFVNVPRKEYEEFLQLRNIVPIVKMTSKEKREWEQAKKDYKQGKFVTLEELEHDLGIAHT